MAKVIKTKKGLDINLDGKAKASVSKLTTEGLYALCPDDFYGFKPRMVVREGDHVDAGDAIFVSKNEPELKVVAQVSGKVAAIVRGERRKILHIAIEADAQQNYKAFTPGKPDTMGADDMKACLLDCGLFAFIKQRPYDVTASAADMPKAIFISAFSKMPLAADYSYVVEGNEQDLALGLKALSRMAPVYLGICPEQEGKAFAQTTDAEVTIFDGPNPSGNVGVQINHVAPINKGEVVWTIGLEETVFIGRFFRTGKIDLTRKIALAGSGIAEPKYYETLIGTPIKRIIGTQLAESAHTRIINGNPLVGTATTMDGFVAAHATEVTVIPEGDDVDEVLGWIRPRINQFSSSRSYLSWLFPKKAYTIDARIKGGGRHMIMSGEYDRVFPMDIYAEYLVKAILTADIDRMEQLGIYEVAPEDFAVAEFVDSSKLELQRIVREGLDMLRTEMN